MGCLLGQADPNLVLLGPFAAEQGKDGHDDKDEYYAQLNIGIIGQATKHQALAEADFHIVAGAVEVDGDVVAALLHGTGPTANVVERVGCRLATHHQIAVVLNPSLLVDDDHGDVLVAAYHLQHQGQVCGLVSLVERVHGFGPHLHVSALLLEQVAHQEVRHHQRCHGNHHSSHDQQDFHLPNSVCPYHIIHN